MFPRAVLKTIQNLRHTLSLLIIDSAKPGNPQNPCKDGKERTSSLKLSFGLQMWTLA